MNNANNESGIMSNRNMGLDPNRLEKEFRKSLLIRYGKCDISHRF